MAAQTESGLDRSDAIRERRLSRSDSADVLRRHGTRGHGTLRSSNGRAWHRVLARFRSQRRQLADRHQSCHVEHDAGDEGAGRYADWPRRARVPATTDNSGSVSSAWRDTVCADNSSVDTLVIAEAQARHAATTGWKKATDPKAARHFDEKCLDWLLDCQHVDPHPYHRRLARRLGLDRSRRAACPTPTTRPARTVALRTCAASLSAAQAASAAAGRPTRRRVAARTAEQRRRLADVLSRLEQLACFDRSASDLTAHAVRALAAWQRIWQSAMPATYSPRGASRATPDERIAAAIDIGFHFWNKNNATTAASCRCGSAISIIRKATIWCMARHGC